MANNRTVTDILQELKKDYKSVLLKAVEHATDIACEDMYKFSMSVLDRYYDSYMPSRYDRTDQLWQTAIPVAKVENMGDVIIGTFGVDYDPSVLEGVYNGSQKYGHPDGSWVLENFLMGIHPRTDGSRVPGGGNYEAEKWIDPVSPDEYLKKYLGLRAKKFENDVNEYLISYIAK